MINLRFNKKIRLYSSYGLLYNWHTVNDPRGLAPEGWHIPSNLEFTALGIYLGITAGGKLKESGIIHWNNPNTGATNETGFTALGAGYRENDGEFSNLKNRSYYWKSNGSGINASMETLFYNFDGLGTGTANKKYGNSVRCIRDITNGWVAGEQIADYDGNIYDTIQIGTQIWLKQNLSVRHYRDGTEIPEVTDNTIWSGLLTDALCAYNNDWNNVFEN